LSSNGGQVTFFLPSQPSQHCTTFKKATGFGAKRKAQKAFDTVNEFYETHRSEDIAKSVFVPVSHLPKAEPKKAAVKSALLY